ncbi:MAG: cob(I)yrinic acid a,c-diamide adenosyltransferase [Sterolibacterium sp.]|jgi:cob(I)alamin adenosyltransferase|nr:cob(I)yrinic acid a,c-diamide adenosyltransferase [Sterolibacterium sp.]
MQRKKALIDARIATAQTERGILIVNTGNGKGKSTAAFGLVARALGHGQQVAVIQFVKSRTDTGEEACLRRFPQIAWHVMGEGFTWETQDETRDALAAQAAWQTACRYLADPAIQLVVLDEFTYAFKHGWLEIADVLAILQARPPMQHVVITGRAAPQSLIDAADTVTEMKLTKHAYTQGVAAMPGIEW